MSVEKVYSDEELFRALDADFHFEQRELTQRAKFGNAHEMYRAGLFYTTLIEEHSKALAWYRKAADLGHSDAQRSVGQAYNDGKGVPVDYRKAMKWFLRSIFNDNNPSAYHSLGMMYSSGFGVPRNLHTAIKWFTLSANKGCSSAQLSLGMMYQRKDQVENLQLAANYLHKAYCNDLTFVDVWLKRLEALGYYPQVEEQENKVSSDDPLIRDLKDDISLTEDEIQKAKDGDVETLFHIGKQYYNYVSYSKALEWYRKAADQNHSQSQCRMGNIYELGKGVDIDYDQAMYWYLKAVDNDGNEDAQFRIGVMYEKGRGVSEDNDIAVEWYEKASIKGHAQSIHRLIWLRKPVPFGKWNDSDTSTEKYTKSSDVNTSTDNQSRVDREVPDVTQTREKLVEDTVDANISEEAEAEPEEEKEDADDDEGLEKVEEERVNSNDSAIEESPTVKNHENSDDVEFLKEKIMKLEEAARINETTIETLKRKLDVSEQNIADQGLEIKRLREASEQTEERKS